MAQRTRQRKWRAYVEGADDIIKTLNSMGEAAVGVLDEAAKEGGRIALEDAKKRCPEYTGNLKNNIALSKVNTKSATRRSYKVGIDKKAYYGVFVELGTKKMKARPFLRPSIDKNTSSIGNEVTRAISNAVGGRM